MEQRTVYWRVREIAEPQRWNAHSLAEASGLAYNTVWLIWNNKAKRADLETLGALARVLDVDPGDLIAWVPLRRNEEAPAAP